MSQNDFHKTHSDPMVFLNCEPSFQLVHGDLFSITNMSDKELRESIICDILCVTMWEKQFCQKLHYGFTRLLQFLPSHMHQRVKNQMQHEEIVDLIVIAKNNIGSEIRIRDNRAILQAAMDYCGVWFTGFVMPNNENIIHYDREAMDVVIENSGGMETLSALIAMDMTATTSGNKTIN